MPSLASSATGSRSAERRAIGAVIGIVSAAVGVAAGMLLAAYIGPAFAPIEVISSALIDLPPAPVKEWFTATFGTAAKPVVVVLVVLVVAGVAAWVGVRSTRRPTFGVQAMVVAGGVGAVVALLRPAPALLGPVPSLVAGGAAALALWLLLRWSAVGDAAHPDSAEPLPVDAVPSVPAATAGNVGQPTVDRRGFVLGAVGLSALAVAGISTARWMSSRGAEVVAKATSLLPRAATPLPPIPPAAQAPVPGMAPFVTPTRDFYRIDTAVIVPRIDSLDWSLTIDGMVRAPLTITYADLLGLPIVERDVTIMCVSNPVGGEYIGTARWLGTPLMPLLERAGIDPAADQLLSRSFDGWTCSTPLDGLAEADPLLAIGMNGEPLPLEHGFPVRMIIPGLYGFISATKWVTRIQATTYAAESAYWSVRGWATDAPVLTGSRIDLPKGDIAAGPTFIAGVAWAMHGDGISRVEVSIDGGTWQEAQLAEQPSPRTWRQWWLPWEATSGRHTIAVRATNGDGETQTADVRDVIPAGATGYDVRDVSVG